MMFAGAPKPPNEAGVSVLVFICILFTLVDRPAAQAETASAGQPTRLGLIFTGAGKLPELIARRSVDLLNDVA